MALLCPDAGERELLRKALKVDEDMSLRLYTAVSPALGEGTVIGHMTEATFTSYAAKTLTRANWSTPATNAGVTSSTYAQGCCRGGPCPCGGVIHSQAVWGPSIIYACDRCDNRDRPR